MARITGRLGADGRPALAFGGDYNPEQWPEQVWAEDVELMREAGVNLVSVGGLRAGRCWNRPRASSTSAGWTGCSTCCTAPASGSTWPTPPPRRRRGSPRRYPESLPVTADGRAAELRLPAGVLPVQRRTTGGRPRALTEAIAERYADHPAVVMWHVHNEYGCHNAPATATSRRRRSATGCAQRYGTWPAERGLGHRVLDPALLRLGPRSCRRARSGTWVNPTQQLDFWRFSLRRAAGLLPRRGRDPAGPHPEHAGDHQLHVASSSRWTTGSWAAELDVVSNDHYLSPTTPDPAERAGDVGGPGARRWPAAGRGC